MVEKTYTARRFERLLFASRWLMAPMYVGLALSLVGLVIVFGREFVHYALLVPTMNSQGAILAGLTLIDLSLAANLVLIVIFSGYENFIASFDIDSGTERPDWMGKVDFQGLKVKLIASIVAITGVDLLKRFMELGGSDYDISKHQLQLIWLVVIHLTFVLSGVLFAFMDWLLARSSGHGKMEEP